MDTKGDFRQFLADRISGFRRHARPEMGLQVWLCPIIVHYVNFWGLIRSRLWTITDGFEWRSPGSWPAAGEPGLISFSPWPRALHSGWMTDVSGWARCELGAGGRERGSRKPEIRNPGTGTPAPLPNVVSVGFFNTFRPFLPIESMNWFCLLFLKSNSIKIGLRGREVRKPLIFVTFSDGVTKMLRKCYSAHV